MKIGIVGTGNISSRHLNEFNNMSNVNVEAVCDTNPKNLEIFLSNNKVSNIRGYLSLEEMLEKEKTFDGISNTTPDKFHKETTLQILKSGYNIFCEKPLAENYSDAKDMVNAAVKSKKINMVNFTYRESSAYQKLVEILKSGEIGIPRHVSACYYQSWLTSNKWGDWREEDKWLWRLSTKHGSNGALGDTGVHIFDFAVNAIGDIKEMDEIKEVRVKVFLKRDSDLSLPSLYTIFKGSDWQERETYDMFGINYIDHPCPKRLLMPEDWRGWPLRKDYIQPDFYELQDAY